MTERIAFDRLEEARDENRVRQSRPNSPDELAAA